MIFNNADKRVPCYNCKDRTVGCHSHCTEYMEFFEQKNKENTEKYKENTDFYEEKKMVFNKINRKRKWKITF